MLKLLWSGVEKRHGIFVLRYSHETLALGLTNGASIAVSLDITLQAYCPIGVVGQLGTGRFYHQKPLTGKALSLVIRKQHTYKFCMRVPEQRRFAGLLRRKRENHKFVFPVTVGYGIIAH